MTKTRIALYLALIFVAGAVAGAGVRTLWQPNRVPPQRPREDFANHLFNQIKNRLELTPEQIEKVEPVFRKGFDDVRAIQDRSLKEVQAAVKRNHEEIASLLTPEQARKLEEMDREREEAFRKRRGRRHGMGSPPPTLEKAVVQPATNSPTTSPPAP